RGSLHPSAVVEDVIVKAGRVGSALPLAARRDPGELLPGAEVEEQRSSGIAVAGVRVAAGLPEGRDEVPTYICPVRKRRRAVLRDHFTGALQARVNAVVDGDAEADDRARPPRPRSFRRT